MSAGVIEWGFLGELAYPRALELQMALKERVKNGQQNTTLLLLEHPPVITLGRSALETNVLASGDELERRGVQLVRVQRGGDVTYHAPGQLVGYLIRRVGRRIRDHVDLIVRVLRDYIALFQVETHWDPEAPGIWTPAGKVAALGIDARGGTTMHGFALNLTIDLKGFELIVPCGMRRPVTSLASLCAAAVPEPRHAAAEIAQRFAVQLAATPIERSPGEFAR